MTTIRPVRRPGSGNRWSAGQAGRYLLLIVVALVFFGPLYWLASSAFKASGDIYQYPPIWLPTHLKLSNFSNAWHTAPFKRYFVNSLIVTGAGAAIKILNATCTAYAFTFLRFPFKRVIFVLILGTLMVPGNVTLIVNYLTMSDLGWVNSYLGLIIPSAGSAFGTFLLRQHMLSLPNEVIEAARVDGAGHLRILWQMVVPMSKPMLVTVSIIAVIDMWNEFIWPLIITNTANMRTLPIGLLQLKSDEGFNDWGAIMAGTTMVAAPVLLLFLITQRYIVAGLTSGAVKG